VLTQRSCRLELELDPLAPGRARRGLAEWLSRFDCPPEIEADVLVVVSELVTNAVVHAGAAPVVVATYDDGHLFVEVHDNDATAPIMRAPGVGSGQGGFGLRLVEALTHRWGWEATPSGKRVWGQVLC
jgi:anti-sigma regulatory factor (Ser/Thr protein kinase)